MGEGGKVSNELEPLQFLGQIVQTFPRDIIDSLWDQGVNMDDWDYAILCPPDAVTSHEEMDRWDGKPYTSYSPVEYTIERMLVGCCDNRWYLAKIRGQEYAIGIAYHA